MKNLALHIIFALISLQLVAQNPTNFQHKKDSINNIIDAKTDDFEKLVALEEAFQYFIRINPGISQEYAQNALSLATKLKEVKKQLEFSIKLGLTYVIQNDYKKALEVYNAGLDIAKKHDSLEQFLNLKMRIASVQLKQGEIESASVLLDSIIKIAKKEKFLKAEGMAVTEMGKMERRNGNYEKSIAYFSRNLEIAEQLNHKGQIAYTYLQLAIDYDKTGDREQALAINRKGIALANATKDKVRLIDFYNNIAVNFRNMEVYDSAFYYQKKVLVAHKNIGNPVNIARSYMNIGTTFSFQKNYKKAISYYDSAYSIMKDKKGHALLGTINQNMGSLYKDQGDFITSNKFNYKALAIAQQKKQTNEYPSIYENIFQAYKGLKQWDSALVYKEKMVVINDSLFNSEKLSNIEHVKRELETTQKQKEIDKLHFEKEQNTMRYVSVFGALLSIIFLVYFWGKNQKRKKILAEQNQQLDEQRVLSLIQEQEILAVNAMIKGQETERQKIAEELHDGIGSSLATLKLHTENLLTNPKNTPESKTNILQKIESIIDETYQKVRNISHIKSTSMVEQKGLLLALEKLCNQINTDNSIQVHIDVFGFEKLARNDLKIFIYNSIQELLTNAIKHAKATEINIQITQLEQEINMLVSDNGSGFEVIDEIFEKGMGLYHIRKKVEILHGKFDIDSTPHKGSTININIPL